VAPTLGADSPAQRLVEFAQACAECVPSEEQVQRVERWFGDGPLPKVCQRLLRGLTSAPNSAAAELRLVAGYHAYKITPTNTEKQSAMRQALDAEELAQCELIRDIFGNPFRPVTFNANWRTDTAVALARGMYGSRDLGAVPILADALQDAGCDSEDVLDHCRGPGPHVRGCWVVDLVLGKQ
jgi:hypothetical protein